MNVGYGWQADGRVAGVTDHLIASGSGSRTATFTYAVTGRVASVSGPWGSNSYAYDALGNLTQNGPTTINVKSTNTWLTGTSGGTARTFTYEPGGELTGDSSTAGVFAYSYNGADHLVEATSAGTAVGAYAYDWAGHLADFAPTGVPLLNPWAHPLGV